ncbi:MAG: aldo/keto reductase [Propionibacteriaceae bacterium]|nr:aldo/keto reductase [Propionibacteriaceae bacterium]
MGVLSEHFDLINGTSIPKLGFGTWQTPNEVAPAAVRTALDAGYTHLDTARVYQNEEGVGEGLRTSGVPRDQVFITTKVPADYKTYEQATASITSSLELLDVDCVDLLLIHAPRPWTEMFTRSTPKTYFEENVAVWAAMEEAYQRGDVRAIGVSNFDIDDIENITSQCSVAPMVNQIRFHVGFTQPEVVAYCQAHDILIEAYSPLGTGKILGDPVIAAVAARVGRTIAQVCIRYTLEKGTLPLPKSVHEEFILANTQVDFDLTDQDMAELDAVIAPPRYQP